MANRQKIFISSYACEPNKGSEIGVGWHWILEMSRNFELWVLTRTSNRKNIEAWLAENKCYPEIHFVYFDLPPYLKFWKKGQRGVRTYYNLWTFFSNNIVKRVMIKNNIDVFHHLTYGNALWSVSSFGMKKTFIWGPIGGLETIPKSFSDRYSSKLRTLESIRRLVVRLLPLNFGLRKRAKCATMILCKTKSTLDSLPSKFRHKAIVVTDVAVELKNNIQLCDCSTYDPMFLAVGRLDAWRGFDLLIEAFAIAKGNLKNATLNILGSGSDCERLQSIIDDNSLQNSIHLVGHVGVDEYYDYLAKCTAVVNPALKEGAVTVAFDSMSFSKPLICFDSGGYTRYFSDEYATILKISTREKAIQDLAKALIEYSDLDHARNKGMLARERAERYSWKVKGEQICEMFSNL